VDSPLELIPEFDRFLEFVDSTENKDKLKVILEEVDPLEINIPFFDYKPTQEILEPIDITKLEGDTLKEVVRRMGKETAINGKSRISNTLISLRMACNIKGPDTFKNLPAIRRLKYYLQQTSFDPIVETSRGTISVTDTTVDCMASVRMITLMNCALHSVMNMLPGWSDVLDEMAVFLFQNPFVNTSKLKKASSILKQMMFSISTTGYAVQWIPDTGLGKEPNDHHYSSYTFQPISELGNDRAAYIANRSEIEDSIKELKKLGLTKTALAYKKMLSIEVNKKNITRASYLIFPEAMSGFLRADDELNWMKQHIKSHPWQTNPITKEKGDPDTHKEPPKFQPYLDRLWGEFVRDGFKDHLFVDYPTWERRLMSYMTPKASGWSTEFNVNLGGEDISITATDKTINFMSHVDEWVDPETVKTRHTIENPGKLFVRNVPARDQRTVFGADAAVYVAETHFGSALLRWQSTHPNYTITRQVGRVLADHRAGMVESANPYTLILLMDFSAFDTSQKYANMRKPTIDAVKKAVKAEGFDVDGKNLYLTGSWGPWKDFLEPVVVVWEKTRDAVYKAGRWLLHTDQLGSGEFMTITINNMTNLANFRYSVDQLYLQMPEFRTYIPGEIQFMGDDSMSIYKKAKGSIVGNGDSKSVFSSDELVKLRKVLSQAASDNGLDLSEPKTSVRCFYYEYLKKMAVYGWIISRFPQLHFLCSERPSFRDPVLETLRSYVSFASEFVSRGADPDVVMVFMLHTWNLKRRVKYRDRGVSKFYTMPFSLYWTPLELGGIGVHPNTFYGANKDAVMYNLYSQDMNDSLSYASAIVNSVGEQFRDKIAAEILETNDVFNPGRRFLNKTLLPNVVERSIKADEHLKAVGLDVVGNLAYSKTPRRILTRALADQGKFREVLNAQKQSDVGRMDEKERELRRNRTNTVTFIHYPYDDIHILAHYLRELRGYTFVVEHGDFTYTHLLGKIGVVITKQEIAGAVSISKDPDSLADFNISEINDLDIHELRRFLPSVGSHIDPMYHKYSWQNGFFFEFTDLGSELEKEYSNSPISGTSEEIDRVMNQIGMSTANDDLILKITRLNAMLSKDPTLPRDITAESLLGVLSNPVFKNDPLLAAEVLVAVGMSDENASKFSAQLQSLSSDFIFMDQTDSFSTKDMIIGLMDMRKINQEKYVSVFDWADNKLHDTLTGMGFLAMLLNSKNGIKKCAVRFHGNRMKEMIKRIQGSVYEPGLQYVDYIPNHIY
jgi:hypothetical protein